MKFIKTIIPDVYIIEPQIWGDSRGYFIETYKQELVNSNVGKINFIQDNESKSRFGVLRGLHYQIGEFAQAKLVRVIQGSVLDIAVDIRRSSSTFGQFVAVELTGDNKRQLFVPRGFAHGFLVTSPEAIFTYKVDNIYSPQNERCILYNDPAIGIDWGIDENQMELSEKDKNGVLFKNAELFD